jgi:hypothetical protein
MKPIIALLLVSTLTGCMHYLYFNSKLGEATKCEISLDLYKLYVRKVGKRTLGGEIKVETNNSKEIDSTLEVQYLLVSDNGNVIYISTIGDAKRRYYYRNFLADNLLNVHECKKICFGIMTGNRISFVSKKDPRDKDIWVLQSSDSAKIVLENVEERKKDLFEDLIPVSEALQEPVSFERVPYYDIVYKDSPGTNEAIKMDSPKIYLLENKKNQYEIYFHFNKPVFGNYQNIYFGGYRLPYTPVKFFAR